jgi:plastocyanin
LPFTNVFTGSTIYTAEVSLTKLDLVADVHLYWPTETAVGVPLASDIVEISSTTSSNWSIYLPNAMLVSVGETILFNNRTAETISIKNYSGTTLLSIPSGTQWQLYVATNTTQNGVWRQYQFGAATSTANAGALAGLGLIADGSTLDTAIPQVNINTSTVLVADDRASFYNWEGSVGTIELPEATVVGNNWFAHIRNSGSGDITISGPTTELVNESASLQMSPGDSATFVTDGVDYYTVGLGQAAIFAFDYVVVNVTGSTDYTLTGNELNRIAYQFVGTMGANFTIIVPNTTQQYWVYNNTTGGFDLSIGTAGQVTPLDITNGTRTIVYCDGTDVVPAVTSFVTGTISGGVF